MARTGTPPREKARVYRTGRPDRLRPLLFAVAALILCAGIGAVLWHEWQGTRPTAAEQAEADEIERADGGEEEIAAVVNGRSTIFFEALPLSLEEVFISEMEAAGYDLDRIRS